MSINIGNGKNIDNISAGVVPDPLSINELVVAGDTTLNDFTAVNGNISGTLQVNTLISDIKTEDTIIHLGVNNPANSLNLGIIEEYQNAGTKFSGIIRYFGDDKHYLINGASPIPTGITNIPALTRGDLICKDIDTNRLTATNISVPNIENVNEIKINNRLVFNGDVGWTYDNFGLTYQYLPQSDITKITLRGSKIYQQQSFNSTEGVVDIREVSRGTLVAKIASLINDRIYQQRNLAYDGTSLNSITYIEHKCSENQTPTTRGGKIILSTINNGAIGLTEKFIIDDDVEITNCNLKLFLNDINDVNFLTAINGTIDNLTLGTPTNTYTLPSIKGTNGQYLQTDAGGVVSWQSFETASFGEQYFTGNATSTPTTTLDQYTDILGTRISGNLQNFTSEALTLTYTGTPTQTFLLNFSAEWISDGNQANVYGLGFHKNNILVIEGQMEGQLDDNVASYPRNVSTSCLVSLATNDTITIKARNREGTQACIFQALIFTATSINGGGVVGGGGGGAQTLEDTYLLSSAPQITINGTQGKLVLKHSGHIDDGVLEIQDNLGTPNISMLQNGAMFCSSLQTTGLIQMGTIRNQGLYYQGVFPDEYTLPQDKTTATDGDVLTYNATSSALEFKAIPIVGFQTHARITDRTIVANALQLALTDGSPNLLVPANTIKIGDSFKIISSGNIRFLNNAQQFSFKIWFGNPLSGGTIVAEIPLLSNAPVAQGTLQYYKFESIITFRTLGALGSVADSSSFDLSLNKGQAYASSTRTANTTIDREWYVSFQWGTNSASNEIVQTILTIEQI